MQFCETSYDIELTTESDFIICGLNTEFPLAVYIPRDTISTQDEAAMTMTITCNMTQKHCNSEDDDVEDIGPTLSFTPHCYNFLRPILVFMYLPDRYQTKEKDNEYAVLYSNTGRDEEPIWEDVTGFDHYPVSGVVIPCSGLAILRFTHFCSSKVVVQTSEKTCVANVFAFVDHACQGVCITCLFCPKRHKGQRLYEERSAIIKGSLEKSKVFCVSNANSPVSLEATPSNSSWKIEHEEDKKQIVAHSLVWKGKYPDSEFVFIPVRDADCLPPIFRCRLELKHESHLTITYVAIPTQASSPTLENSGTKTASFGEPCKSGFKGCDEATPDQLLALTNEPKSLASNFKNQSPSQLGHNNHADIVEKNIDGLVHGIILDPELWVQLRSQRIVSDIQMEDIRQTGGTGYQILKILDMVKRMSDEQFFGFREALNKSNQGHIVTEYLTHVKVPTKLYYSQEHLVAFLKTVVAIVEGKKFFDDYDMEMVRKRLTDFIIRGQATETLV